MREEALGFRFSPRLSFRVRPFDSEAIEARSLRSLASQFIGPRQ